ncbi:MAG TPA: clostripain-related cysteine peptidase [Chloroflexota bacterium]|nr:clostripain-related cysteine peptidase [Chloroflexota bacterium]
MNHKWFFVICLLVVLLAACEMPGGATVIPTAIQPLATLAVSTPDASIPTPTTTLATPTPPATSAPLPTATHDGALADWTILVYMAADNNLEQAALLDINEMEAAGSSEKVHLLVQIDRAAGESVAQGDWTDTRRYRILGDADPTTITAEPLLTLGEQNMGDPAVLADFIRWGMANYPANRTALILWNHGMGWAGFAFDNDTAEYGAPDHLSLADLDGALAAVGVSQLDIVAFDACLMGQLDVFNVLRPYAHIAVASAELTPGLGWNYEDLLRSLYARPQIDGRDLARQMVESFINHYTAVAREDFVTMAALDLAQVPALTYQVEQLAAALVQEPAFVASAIGDARSGAETFARVYPEQVDRYAAVDLYHFASILAQRSPDEAVKAAAEGVMTAVNQAILTSGRGAGFKNSQGIAVYFPRRAEFYDALYGDVTGLPNWHAFLQSYHQVGQAALSPPTLTLHNRLNSVVGVQDPAFVQFQVAGRDIEMVRLLVTQNGDDGRRRLVEYDNLIPEPTYLPDGSQISEWRDGVHDDFFIWDTEVTYLYDADGNGDYVVMWPTVYGSPQFTVQGRLRRANEEGYVDANLVFDHSTGQLSKVWAVQSNESGAPAEILPQPGDEFQLYDFYEVDATFSREPGISLTFDGNRQLYYEWLPLPDGRYALGMAAENVAGDTAVQFLDLTVTNREELADFQAYLDPYLGFRFLYPQSWYEPRYQETLLYTASQITDTQLLITIYPNLAGDVTAETLKQQTLHQFGAVDVLFEESQVADGRQALSTAYGYTNTEGIPHTGIFLTFVDANGNGYVVDVDGRASDETNTIAHMHTIAATWEFGQAALGLQPGQWATIDLDSFSVAQPASFVYQPAKGWERFNAGQYTFVALRTQPASRDVADVVAALVRDAGAGMDNFRVGSSALFPLGGYVWHRVEFSYDVAGLGTVWGFIMARVQEGQEVVAWAEAPAASYNHLANTVFLTMIADMTLKE